MGRWTDPYPWVSAPCGLHNQGEWPWVTSAVSQMGSLKMAGEAMSSLQSLEEPKGFCPRVGDGDSLALARITASHCISSAHGLQSRSSSGQLYLWKKYKKTNYQLVNTVWEIKAFKIAGPWREDRKILKVFGEHFNFCFRCHMTFR